MDHFSAKLFYLLLIALVIMAGSALIWYIIAKKENPLTDIPMDEDPDYIDEDSSDSDWVDYGSAEDSSEEVVEEVAETVTDMNTLTQDPKNPNLLINTAGDSRKVAILIGTNVCDPEIYQGDTLKLKGCVNDALNIRKLAVKYGFGRIYFLTDAHATIDNFLKAWKSATETIADGDTLLLQRSGHGMSLDMNVLDRKNDTEIGGTNEDGTIYSGDQGSVLHDGVIVDDVYWRLLLTLPRVKVIYINDSCHSATQYKLMNSVKTGNAYRKARSVSRDYLPTKNNVLDLAQLDKNVPKPVNEELKCTLISIAGCQEYEYSQDAYLDRKYQGAATCCLMSIYQHNPAPTPKQIKEQLPILLKSRGFTQHPQVNIEGDPVAWDQPLL